jgi:hypothetical protein
VGGSEAEKVTGSNMFLKYFHGVFELPLPRNTRTRLKKPEKKSALQRQVVLQKPLFLVKRFGVVFLNSPHQGTPKNAINQTKSRKTHMLFFWSIFVNNFRQGK